ncbi:MAG: hypothetical protein JST54_24255 [Deltaproteobacteria bacterium]|nr:hypothetical protein [Deltaproteobacteria bacterium]
MRFVFLVTFNFLFSIAGYLVLAVVSTSLPFLRWYVPLSPSGDVSIPLWPLLWVAVATLGAVGSFRLAGRVFPPARQRATAQAIR